MFLTLFFTVPDVITLCPNNIYYSPQDVGTSLILNAVNTVIVFVYYC